MAEAVGRESETAESSTPESDGPGGPDTQQEDDYLGDNELVQVAKLRHKLDPKDRVPPGSAYFAP